MILSDHASEEMVKEGISEQEVRECLEHGELEIKQIVSGEVRYGKKLKLKEKIIMIIYTIRDEQERIITAYTIHRRKTWQKE